MRKTAVMLMTVLICGLMTGCMGTPNWVQKGSGVRKAKWNTGIYGVGKAAPVVEKNVQQDLASMDARTAVDQVEREYVGGLFQDFVDAHPDWFKAQQVSELGLPAKAADGVARETIYRMEKVDEWTDEKGKTAEAGTMYVARQIPLDQQFFSTVLDNFKSTIEQNQEQILRVELEEVLQGLQMAIMDCAADPLAAAGAMPAEKQMQMGKTTPPAEEPMEGKETGGTEMEMEAKEAE